MIEVRHVRKVYGQTTAVDDLSFDAPAGQVTALVGPHGAGKSTTLRVILGLDAPQAGMATIADRAYRNLRRPLRLVGASLDRDAVHPGRTARNHLLWLARSHRIGARCVDEVLDQVGLAEHGRRRAGELSVAARQRLGVAAALLGDPGTIVLDEPFDGLDPEGVDCLCDLLRDTAAEGRTVLVASRLLPELDGTADHLVLLGRGRLIADTSVSALVDSASDGRVQVRTTRPTDTLEALVGSRNVSITVTEHDVLVVTGMSAPQVTAALEDAEVPTTEVSPHRASLVEACMELTRDGSDPTTEQKETDVQSFTALREEEIRPRTVRRWVWWLAGGVLLLVVLATAWMLLVWTMLTVTIEQPLQETQTSMARHDPAGGLQAASEAYTGPVGDRADLKEADDA